eukprot:COSAG01_NODE_1361_length_10566_cov_2.658674_6_plen_72_part_00
MAYMLTGIFLHQTCFCQETKERNARWVGGRGLHRFTGAMTGLWAAVNDTIQRTTGEISVGRKGYFLTPPRD